MKKTTKIIALCLCLALFGVLFAGCDMLDELKANQAFLSDDKSTITYNGNTYKKLPNDAFLYLNFGYYHGNEINITDNDVPVLLSNSYKYYSQYEQTKDIFIIYPGYESLYIPFSSNYAYGECEYYCNEKDYDKYISAIEKNELNYIGFEYDIEYEDYNFYTTLEAGTKELSDEILAHIANPEKMSNELYLQVEADYDFDCLMYCMYKCDSEGLIAETLDGYDVKRNSDGDAYLMDHESQKAVKLSDKTTSQLKDVYFYGSYQDYEDIYGEFLGIIGSDDGNEEFVVGEANLFAVDF